MFSDFGTATFLPSDEISSVAYNRGHRGLWMPRFRPKGMLERNALADLMEAHPFADPQRIRKAGLSGLPARHELGRLSSPWIKHCFRT